MDDLLKLAERCEAATAPDRDLDRLILKECGWLEVVSFAYSWQDPQGQMQKDAPRPTASLDAAMTLIDDSEIWGVSKQEHNPGRDYYYHASVMPFGPKPWHEAKAGTAALALCAAALRARAAGTI